MGRFLVVSRRYKRVRMTTIFLFSNFFFVAAAVLTAEILLICLSLMDVYIPLPSRVSNVLVHLML